VALTWSRIIMEICGGIVSKMGKEREKRLSDRAINTRCRGYDVGMPRVFF
jgi:hypothetical protein